MKYRMGNIPVLAGLVVTLTACKPAPPVAGTVSTPHEIGDAVRQVHAPLTLVHIWATWCGPCREEFPDVLEVFRTMNGHGLALLLVSADDPEDLEKVNVFLREQDSPVGSLVSTDLNQDFIELFSSDWSGALPASFFYDANGKLVAEWQGKHSYDEYLDMIERLLNPWKGATS